MDQSKPQRCMAECDHQMGWRLSMPEQKSFAFGLDPDDHIYFGISRDGTDGGALSVSSISIVPIGEWTHVVGSYDGTTVRVYVNGSLETSVSFSSVGNII